MTLLRTFIICHSLTFKNYSIALFIKEVLETEYECRQWVEISTTQVNITVTCWHLGSNFFFWPLLDCTAVRMVDFHWKNKIQKRYDLCMWNVLKRKLSRAEMLALSIISFSSFPIFFCVQRNFRWWCVACTCWCLCVNSCYCDIQWCAICYWVKK